MYFKNNFSSRLKDLRIKSNLSQGALGEIIGIKAQAINDMEHGRVKTTLERACALADYFGVSLDYLVGLSDDPERR